MTNPRKIFSAIGATQQSARDAIGALGPSSPTSSAPLVGQVLTWNGAAYVPGAGGGGGGAIERYFVFQVGAPPKIGNVYGDWATMFADIFVLPDGEQPFVSFVSLGAGPINVPLVGMPVNGWDMRGGRWGSFYAATGSVVVNIPNGGMIDMLFGWQDGLVVKIDPAPGTGVFNFSGIPIGAAYIIGIGGGSAIDHSTNTGAMVRSPGGIFSTTMVIAMSGEQLIAPPLTGPLLELTGDDGAVGAQLQSVAGLPDGWLVGGGVGSSLLVISDVKGNDPTSPTFAPGFTGGGGSTFLNFDRALMLSFTPSAPGDWAGSPTNTQEAIDRIAAAVSGLLGGPIP